MSICVLDMRLKAAHVPFLHGQSLDLGFTKCNLKTEDDEKYVNPMIQCHGYFRFTSVTSCVLHLKLAMTRTGQTPPD
jgi:hypothetical protein